MIIEKAENFVSKKDEKLRTKAGLLSIRAREAAGVVQQFGKAVIEGSALISAGDVNQMVKRLFYYADWLDRIASGEDVAEQDLIKMEEIIASIRIPKRNTYKRDILELVYVATDDNTGKATRHKLLEIPTGEILVGDTIKIPAFKAGENEYGKRLPRRN